MSKTLTAGAIVALAATLVLGPQPAGAAPLRSSGAHPAGAGISLQPAHVDPAHPVSYFTFHSATGTQVSDAVRITNKSKVAVTLNVSAVDGLTGQTTGSVYGNQGDPVSKAGAWVSPAQHSISLAPRSTKYMSFTVSIPSDAIAGDHLAGLAFQSPPTVIATGGVREVIRNVIGVLMVVPGAARFHPKLTSMVITQIGLTGIAAVVVGLGDDGLLLGKPRLRVRLIAQSGYRKTQSTQLNTVLPGDNVKFPFAWPDRLARGRYDMTAWLTGGGVTVVLHIGYFLGRELAGTTQPSTPVTSASPSRHPQAGGRRSSTGTPVALLVLGIAIGLGVGLLILFLILLLRRRRRDEEEDEGGSRTDHDGGPFTPTEPAGTEPAGGGANPSVRV